MNLKLLRLLIVLVFLITYCIARGQCNYAQADKFDNVWVINQGEVICFDKQYNKIGTYSNILLGNPSYTDALDPFRVIVYYPSSQSIVILNNRVAEIAKPIMLTEKGITDASAICKSSKGGFWVLDRNNWEILHFDSGFNQTGERIMLDLAFSGSKPFFMQENKGVLYVAFLGKGICRYDSFGARMGDIRLNIDSYFSFIDNSIAYQSKGEIYLYNLDSNEILPFDLSIKCIPVKVQGQLLYFDGRKLSVNKIR
mgnify:CR=1 FL=1